MNEAVNQIAQPIERMLERLGVDNVFGEPTKEGDVAIIPVAEVGTGFGYGFGWGQSTDETAEAGQGGGGGGGAGGRARPVGYIHITPDKVTFQPINDETRIALAGIAMGAWAVFWISKTIRACARTCADVFAEKRSSAESNA